MWCAPAIKHKVTYPQIKAHIRNQTWKHMLLSPSTTITRQYANPGKGYKWWYIHNASQIYTWKHVTYKWQIPLFQPSQAQVDKKKEHHCERSQSVLEQNVAFEQHHHHASYPKNISECEALSEPQLHSIHNFLFINVITANCRMSNPWHTSGSNSVLWLHIRPCQSCTYERFRVQVDHQDWGQSTMSILRARPAPHIKTC